MDYKLYPKNKSASLDTELFKNPTSEYRGTPFWAWNCVLREDMLRFQIRALHEMGFGGFHMHSRTGMATPYLSDEFMQLVSACTDEAKKNGMLAWLYDEDRYSSGQAGGLALQDPRFRQRRMSLTDTKCEGVQDRETAYRNGGVWFLAAYDVKLDDGGCLLSYKRIGEDDNAEGKKLYAYCIADADSGWFNDKCHIDSISKEAMDEFIRITYDAYKNAVGDEYGKAIPAMFTDEPQYGKFEKYDERRSEKAHCAWTYDFEKTYADEFGCDILDTLPDIFLDRADGCLSLPRHRYFLHLSRRFAEAFLDNCSERCEKDGLLMTGHLMGEGHLRTVTEFVGDPILSYRRMQLPGIDMLGNSMELETCLQCRTAVRQYGREGMLSELYGVTGYDFGFRDHKFQGDWQAAMGVTVRVPHLSWVSMEGNAKRDYPATINYQAPWYKEYKAVEDHFARLATVLTRGTPVCDVAVVNPIESFRLFFGPDATSAEKREIYEVQNGTGNVLTNMLLFGGIDFDYLSEALLPEQGASSKDGVLSVGKMNYRAVFLRGNVTLRRTTVKTLLDFAKAGGRVIVAGAAPEYEDFVPVKDSEFLGTLLGLCEYVPLEKSKVLGALEDLRRFSLKSETGALAPAKLSQLRQDGKVQYLFTANADRGYLSGKVGAENITYEVKGHKKITLLDTLTGGEETVSTRFKGGSTVFTIPFYSNTSVLLRLSDSEEETAAERKDTRKADRVIDFRKPVAYSLTERNAYILDLAQWSVNGGELHPEEEVLRLDNLARAAVGLGRRSNHSPQPWCVKAEKPRYSITLRFTVNSELEVPDALLAIERPQDCRILFNGTEIDSTNITGFYVDDSIKTLPLPTIPCGESVLEVTLPLDKRTNTEWCYILGNFGVRVLGCEKTITALPEKLGFGSTVPQGLPFYGHSVVYKTEFDLEKPSDIAVNIHRYSAHLLRLFIDGEDVGTIAYAPYRLACAGLCAGRHTLEICAFGNLQNTFGPLHFCGNDKNTGPDKWYTVGDRFSYEYNPREFGVLSSPEIEVYEKN